MPAWNTPMKYNPGENSVPLSNCAEIGLGSQSPPTAESGRGHKKQQKGLLQVYQGDM